MLEQRLTLKAPAHNNPAAQNTAPSTDGALNLISLASVLRVAVVRVAESGTSVCGESFWVGDLYLM